MALVKIYIVLLLLVPFGTMAMESTGFPLADELGLSNPHAGVRLKDIVDFGGVRDNQLTDLVSWSVYLILVMMLRLCCY